ncbi:MAG: IS1595 family transposase [Planctomycetota bacterium]|nr:IS1595 family transposase [Planctomycetota bacterium]
MNTEHNYPKTLLESVRYFSDLDVAHAFFTKMRWPDGVVRCPACDSIDVKFLAKYRRWECKNKHPRRQFTVKVGTIMEDSPLGLDKWAVAFWLEANAKNSISSYEIHRALGITQKSAWFMQHRIRLAMQSEGSVKIGGAGGAGVEVDETFIGGLARNMHKSRRDKVITGTGGSGKTVVMGLLERHGGKKCSQVRATVIPDTRKETLHPIIRHNVEPGAEVFTDEHAGYTGISSEYVHGVINHAEAYVNGNIHTNGMENFWALFKRCIKGTHISVEPFHLFRYLDSECFRFNNREVEDGDRFRLALRGMTGKRLTYKGLTGDLELHPTSNDSGVANANLPN